MEKTLAAIMTRDLQDATEALAQNLLRAEPVLAFRLANDRLQADGQAAALLDRLAAAQAELRSRQARNDVTQGDIENFRSLQAAAQANQAIMSFAQAQQSAMTYLGEINGEISQALGVDFAALARPSCCG